MQKVESLKRNWGICTTENNQLKYKYFLESLKTKAILQMTCRRYPKISLQGMYSLLMFIWKYLRRKSLQTHPSQPVSTHSKRRDSHFQKPTATSKNQHQSRLPINSSILQRIKIRGLHINVRASTNRVCIRKILQQYDVSSLKNIIIQAGGNDVSNQLYMEATENDFSKTNNKTKEEEDKH